MNKKKEAIQWLIIINLTLIGLFLFSNLDFLLSPISKISSALFIPIVLAIFLYYLVRPLKRFLEKQKISSGIATALSMATVITVIILIVLYSSSIIASQGQELISMLVDSIQTLGDKYSYALPALNNIVNLDQIMAQLGDYISNSFTDITKNIYIFASSIGNFIAQLVLIPIIMFYILKDDRKIFGTFTSFIPKRPKELIMKILHEIDTVLKQYITCQVMVACVIGVLMFIGYVVLGMPNALVLSLFALITAFIPFLGVVIGILPALVIALSMGFGMLLKIVILTVIVQQLEGNVITPNITGNQLNMHPLTTILVVTASAYFGGFLAVFLAVPFYNIVKVIVKNVYEYYIRKKSIVI